MTLAYIAAVTLWMSIIAYAVLGGSDFGGGIWEFVNLTGDKSKRQERQKLITGALGPVWEANNVWIIYLIVGLVTAFPIVSAVLTTALFIPISLALIGIVLRGASFGFRSHFSQAVEVRAFWGGLFSAASLITPFLLGTCAAAVASGDIRVPHGNIPIALWGAWLTPFALDAGAMALAICASLAAVYLTVEARMNGNEELANAFRLRAFIAEAFVGVFALLGLFLSSFEAPMLWHGMLSHALWAVGVTGILGAALIGALLYRRYKIARILVIMEVGALLGTWGLAQLPYIVPPDLTIPGTASPPTTLWEFLASVAVGMSILLPSLWFLFHVFKGRNPVPLVHEKEIEGA